jgi:hypothetical protein
VNQVAAVDTLRVHLRSDVECSSTGPGTMRVRGPLLRRSGFARFMGWLLRAPSRCEVELDAVGAFVVARCDGRPLREVVDALIDHYKLTRREAEVALADFVKSLLKRRLIRIEAENS